MTRKTQEVRDLEEAMLAVGRIRTETMFVDSSADAFLHLAEQSMHQARRIMKAESRQALRDELGNTPQKSRLGSSEGQRSSSG